MRFALLPAVVLIAVACSRSPQTQAEPATARTTVRVENQSFLDMNIYVLRGSERIRLGTATGSSNTVLTIPRMVVPASTSLRFLADPIGGARVPVSEELTVRPGDEVTLTIPPG